MQAQFADCVCLAATGNSTAAAGLAPGRFSTGAGGVPGEGVAPGPAAPVSPGEGVAPGPAAPLTPGACPRDCGTVTIVYLVVAFISTLITSTFVVPVLSLGMR